MSFLDKESRDCSTVCLVVASRTHCGALAMGTIALVIHLPMDPVPPHAQTTRLSWLEMKSTHQMSAAGLQRGWDITNSWSELTFFMLVCFFGFRTGRRPVDCPLNKCRQAVTGCPTAHWLWWGMDLINYQFERDLSCLILWANGCFCVWSSQACSQVKFRDFNIAEKKQRKTLSG